MWATKKVSRVRNAKKRAWIKYKKSNQDQKLHNKYKCKLRLSVKTNREAKHNFEHRLADNIKKNPKSLYAYVSSKSRSNNTVGSLLDSDKVLSDRREIANFLNAYFSSVFTGEDLVNISEPSKVFSSTNENSLYDIRITE